MFPIIYVYSFKLIYFVVINRNRGTLRDNGLLILAYVVDKPVYAESGIKNQENNECVNNVVCCSHYCFKKADWKYGLYRDPHDPSSKHIYGKDNEFLI